jgi:hypothetical protein
MNIYEKVTKGLRLAGHHASIIQQSADDIGVWIEVWNHDLQECHEFRIHEEEMAYWAEYYDENKDK